MESKRKKRKVRKVNSARPKVSKAKKPETTEPVPTEEQALIFYNARLVKELLDSQPWKQIVEPLITESIAGVSGRLTNGRYYHGTFTKDWSGDTSIFLAGYQKAIMDLNNHINDFLVAGDNLKEKMKAEYEYKEGVVYNPFMEEFDEEIGK